MKHWLLAMVNRRKYQHDWHDHHDCAHVADLNRSYGGPAVGASMPRGSAARAANRLAPFRDELADAFDSLRLDPEAPAGFQVARPESGVVGIGDMA